MTLNKNILLVVILIVILISRLPFLNAGYGNDPDAWRVYLSAEKLSSTGVYEVSRFPGNPFQEIFYSIVPFKIPFIFNLITTLFLIGCCILLSEISKSAKINKPHLVILLFAFTPIIYINSTISMDYIWALFFLLFAFYLIINKKFVLSGILLGFAVGCRISSLTFLIPLFIILDGNIKVKLSNALKLSISTGVTSLIIFIPVLIMYKLDFLVYYDYGLKSIAAIIYSSTIGLWGFIGFCFLLIIMFFNWKNLLQSFKNQKMFKDKIVLSWLSAIIIYFLLFLKLPIESGYLIPIIPFSILLLAKLLNNFSMKLLAIGMILSSFLFTLNRDRFHIPGPVIFDYNRRVNEIKFVENVIQKCKGIKQESIVVAGTYYPMIKALLDDKGLMNIDFRYLILKSEERELLDASKQIYYLKNQDQYNLDAENVDLMNYRAKKINPE